MIFLPFCLSLPLSFHSLPTKTLRMNRSQTGIFPLAVGGGDGGVSRRSGQVHQFSSVPGNAVGKPGIMEFPLACFNGCNWTLPPMRGIVMASVSVRARPKSLITSADNNTNTNGKTITKKKSRTRQKQWLRPCGIRIIYVHFMAPIHKWPLSWQSPSWAFVFHLLSEKTAIDDRSPG